MCKNRKFFFYENVQESQNLFCKNVQESQNVDVSLFTFFGAAQQLSSFKTIAVLSSLPYF